MTYLKPFILSLLSCLWSITAFSQKVTSKDLAGNWHAADTSMTAPGYAFKFFDSNKVEFSLMNISAGVLDYSIDNSTNPPSIFIHGTSSMGIKFKDIWLIKMMGIDTMKIQSKMLFNPLANNNQNTSETPKWDDKETFQNTGILVRNIQ